LYEFFKTVLNKFVLWIKIFKNGSNKIYWSDNYDVSYSNWPSGFNASDPENNNKCAFYENKNSLWNAGQCDSQNDFICKISKGNYFFNL
jgi:hypothetical protein